MKKIFLLNDTIDKVSLSNKIVNKPVFEYFKILANKLNIKELYLISEEEYDGIISLDCNEISSHVDSEDDVIFLSTKLPLVKYKLLDKTFNALEKSQAGLVVVEQTASDVGIYAAKGQLIINEIEDIKDFCIRKVVMNVKSRGVNFDVLSVKSINQFLPVDSMLNLSEADILMRRRINKNHMKDGVFIENPDSVTIEYGVEIGAGTIIENGCRILGQTKIGENCVIGAYSKIEDSVIDKNVKIEHSYIEKSVVEAYTDIGPFARLRPNSHLKEHVHIGNFVEVKNSTLGNGTKAGHLTYVGDADLGEDINVGCGVVFVNYDGKFKHRSVIEDGAFIGSNANIVAPVHVERDGYVAAGSTITKDVKEGYLVVERAERRDVEGYVERKKKRDALKEKK